jgi:Domain of unknown function (DUF4276)
LSSFDLACIVEGHGEVHAVPILVRRIAQALDPSLSVMVHPPFRVPRTKLVKPGELERTVTLAGRRAGRQGAILMILDSDDDCPARLAPEILARVRHARPDLPIGLVFAKREFEAWFLAAAESLRSQRGLAADLVGPVDPEEVRGAKEWLTARMSGSRHYVETLDQPALAAIFNLDLARRAPSFEKLWREVAALLRDTSAEAKPDALS